MELLSWMPFPLMSYTDDEMKSTIFIGNVVDGVILAVGFPIPWVHF